MKAHNIRSKLFDTGVKPKLLTFTCTVRYTEIQKTEKSSHTTKYVGETEKRLYHNYQISNCKCLPISQKVF